MASKKPPAQKKAVLPPVMGKGKKMPKSMPKMKKGMR